jgi:hypothetical protein
MQLQAKCERVLSSFTVPTPPLENFQNFMRSFVTYAFPTGIYNPQNIREFGSVLACFANAKIALYLPLYTPNAIILENVEHVGIYIYRCHLTNGSLPAKHDDLPLQFLNDQGPLGSLIGSMMKMLIEYIGGMSTLTTCARDQKYSE